MAFIEDFNVQADVLFDFYNKPDEEVFSGSGFGEMMKEHNNVIFTGMGSSFAAGYIGAAYLSEMGIKSIAIESDTLEHTLLKNADSKTLVIIISQSGKSPEVVSLAKVISKENMIGMVNEKGSPFDQLTKYKVYLNAGKEGQQAIKTYTNSIYAVLRLADKLLGRTHSYASEINKLVKVMREIISNSENYKNQFTELFAKENNICLLGSGTSYASTVQADIMINELAHINTKFMASGQFFHGLVESVNDKFAAIVFDGDNSYVAPVQRMLDYFKKKNSKYLLITNRKDMEAGFTNAQQQVIYIPLENKYLFPVIEGMFIGMIGYFAGLARGYSGKLNWMNT